MYRVFVCPKLDDPVFEQRMSWLSALVAVVEDDKVKIVSNRFGEEHGESNWDELIDVMKKTTDSHRLDDARAFLDEFEKTKGKTQMKNTNTEKMNDRGNGGREIDPQLKTTDDEPSRASDSSFPLSFRFDTSPLLLFAELLNRSRNRPLRVCDLGFDLFRVESDYSATDTSELIVRFYPSDAFLRFAVTVFARDFNLDFIK